MLERIDKHIFLIKKSSFIFLLFYVETFLGKIYLAILKVKILYFKMKPKLLLWFNEMIFCYEDIII